MTESRYDDATDYLVPGPDGEPVRVETSPRRDRPARLGVHMRRDGERLDHLAWRYLRDATEFWRICDVNDAMAPEALSDAQRRHPGGRAMSGIDAAIVSTAGGVGTVQEIEVLESLGEPTRFRYRVGVPVADGDIPALSRPAYEPGASALVIASDAPIVHGVVTGQRAHLSGDSETSWVDVVGSDRSVEMDRDAKVTSWQFMRSSDVVMAICASYGLIPNIVPTGTFHSPLTHELVQRGTDYAFVRRVARRNGCWFWISVNPIGLETANLQPPPVSGSPVASLSLFVEPTAFDELDVEWDADRPTSVTTMGLDIGSLDSVDASVPASSVPAMAGRNLASINGGRSALAMAPGDDAASLTGPSQSMLNDSEFFVRASGTTTVSRMGRVLHAHEVVALDGLGRRHSGNWLVSEVRHLIDAVSHRMECTFVRNGWEA